MIGRGRISEKRGWAMSQAARGGSVEEFLDCYRPRAARRWVDHRGNTLLHDALCNSDPVTRLHLAQRLLDDGADASVLHCEGLTTAHLLMCRFRPEEPVDQVGLLEALLDGGSDVNHSHPREGTALLTLAARFAFSDQDLAPYYDAFLARPDLDLLVPGPYDRSIWESIRLWRTRRAQLVDLLEERLRREDRLPEETVFSLAVWAGADRILAAYEPENTTAVDPESGWSLLHAALQNSDVEARLAVATRLLDDGADPTAATPEGLTPAHVLLRGHGERDGVREAALLQRLLDLGADPNAVAKKVGTPLNSLAAATNLDEESRLPLYDVLLADPRFDPHTKVGRTKTAWATLRRTRTEVLRKRLEERFPPVPPP